MRLQHLHLPGLTRYAHASSLQSHLVRALLTSKSNPNFHVPSPIILTAEFHPVYTTGRRDAGTLTPAQEAQLRCDGHAEVFEAARGGQTTFHGPGQLVAYPILDLRRHGMSPRCYVHALEEALIKTCAAFGIKAFRT